MMLGGYLGDFVGDVCAYTANMIAGVNGSSQVTYSFTLTEPLPTGAKLFAVANGVVIDRDLANNEQLAFVGSANAYASPAVAPGLDDGVYDPLAAELLALYETAYALATYSKITIRRITWAANVARTMEVEHAVKKDSSEILTEGTVIVHDDAELGRVFYGKIIEVDRTWRAGEGVVYRCADSYRRLTKEPATRDFAGVLIGPDEDYGPGLTSLRFDKGSGVNDTIRKLVEPFEDEVCPGGIHADGTYMPDSLQTLRPLDKLGQSIAQWIDDVLDQTEGGIAYIDPQTRALLIRHYYNEPGVMLTEGSYNVITPSAANPLIVEASIKSTLNNKFERVRVEGVGRFTRHVDVPFSIVYQNGAGVENPSGVWLYVLRAYFPHTNVLGFHYDANDEIASSIIVEFTVTIDGGTPFLVTQVLADADLKRVTDEMDPHFNEVYRDYALVIPGHPGQPAVVVTNGKLRYTSFDGPLFADAASSDPRLRGEGTYMVSRADLFAFQSPGYIEPPSTVLEVPKTGSSEIDPTDELQAQADALKKRYSTRPDSAGRVAVHIKNLTASIKPGTYISNFDARAQSIEFDLVNRDLIVELSDVPIRRETQDAKDRAVLRTETSRQLLINNRLGAGDVSPIRLAGFTRNANMVREDCCEECDCGS